MVAAGADGGYGGTYRCCLQLGRCKRLAMAKRRGNSTACDGIACGDAALSTPLAPLPCPSPQAGEGIRATSAECQKGRVKEQGPHTPPGNRVTFHGCRVEASRATRRRQSRDCRTTSRPARPGIYRWLAPWDRPGANGHSSRWLYQSAVHSHTLPAMSSRPYGLAPFG